MHLALLGDGRLGDGRPVLPLILSAALAELAPPARGFRVTSLDLPAEPPGCLAQTAAGRNDPCPCGSGKKFKKCCRLVGH